MSPTMHRLSLLTCCLLIAAIASPANPLAADEPATAAPARSPATFSPPIAYWIPFTATAPDGRPIRLIVVPSQHPDRCVVLSREFEAWHLTPAEPRPAPDPKPDPKPDPNPEPNPDPDPDPDPEPDPQPTPGPLYALWLYEADELDNMPASQAEILTAKPIRDYLESHCGKENGQATYRFLDDDAEVSRLAPDWQAVFKRAKKHPPPWCIITNGQDTYEGPWPNDVQAALDLLRKYGG